MKVLLFCIPLLINIVQAQYNSITGFTTKNGLSSNNINYILKDKKGFLWVATNNGLNRFDGNNFVKFQKNYNDSNSIGSNFILELLEGDNGSIWANFESGFTLWQPELHRFKNYYLSKFFPARNEKIVTLKNWDKDFLIIATNKSIYLFQIKQNRFLLIDGEFKKKINLPEEEIAITSLLTTSNKCFWVCSNGILFYVNTGNQNVLSYQHTNLNTAIGPRIEFEDPLQNFLYISTYNKGLLIFDCATQQFKNIAVVKNSNPLNNYDPLYSFQPMKPNRYIYNTELNIGIFNPDNLSFTTLLPDSLFDQKVVRQVITDQTGTIWIATSTGLIRAAKEPIQFQRIPKPANQLGSFATVQCLPNKTIVYTSIYNDPFVYQVDPSTNIYSKLPAEGGYVNGVLRNVFIDKKNNLWLSTENEVFLLKTNSTKWQKINILSNLDKTDLFQPRNFAEDQQGIIWLRVRNKGLYYFDSAGLAFQNSGILTFKSPFAFSGMVYNKKQNVIWIAETTTGLFKVHAVKKTSAYYGINEEIPQRNFERIVSDNDSTLWISDAFNGIFKIDLINNQKKHFNTNSGLLSNSNEVVQFDTDGNAWTFSTEGVSAIRGTTNEVVNLQHPNLTRIQNIAVANDHKVYVATNKFIYWWETNGIFESGSKNKLYWDFVTVNNAIIKLEESLQLKYFQNDVSLHFGVMNQGEPIPYNLQYKFLNEAEWVNLNDKSSLSFFRLLPGSYTVQIRLQDESDPSKWLIAKWRIQKPFWQTTLFLILLFLVIGLIVLYFFKKRIQSVRKKAEIQQQITELETQALRAQMNPHFIFNCISSIDNFILGKDAQNASNYLNKFAKLIRNILDHSKKEVIPFWKDWETLMYYIELEQLRNNHSLLCTAEADETLLNGHYKIPPLIIQPYVENAIHHGLRPLINKQGHLKITATLKNNLLEYIIEDNGVGRKTGDIPEKANTLSEHNSYGMELSRKRIDLFNLQMQNAVTITDLKAEDGSPAGTKVSVILKV